MIDVPQLIHDRNNMNSEHHYKPPSYPPSHNVDQLPPPQPEVHNHWHQTTAPTPTRPLRYRRRGCVIAVGLLSVFALIAVSVGIALAVVYILKGRDHGHEEPAAILTTSTTAISTTSSSSFTSESTSELSSSTMTPLESIVTVIVTASESSDAVQTETATLTVTASDKEDLGAMLSSMLSDFTRLSISTELVTVSVTPTQPTTTSTPTSTTPSTSSTTSPSVQSTTSLTPSSTTASTTSSTSSAPPSLATDSNLAAVDVQSGPQNLHRNLLIWQDASAALIALSSASDINPDTVYPIADYAKPPIAKRGTPLTAASDDTGAVHLFYIAKDGSVAHLIQRDHTSWSVQRQSIHPRDTSSLSATWHKGNDTTGAVVLAYQASDGSVILFYGVDAPESDDAAQINISNVLDLNPGDWDNFGLAVTSARMMGDDKDEASLQILVEGRDDVLAAECLVGRGRDGEIDADCYWLNDAFNENGKPIPISSHPTYLSWSTRQSTYPDSPPTIRGFFTLESRGLVLSDHQLGSESDIVSYGISNGGNIEAIVMTTSESLFVRIGRTIWNMYFDREQDNWVAGDEIDTRQTG